MESIKGIMMSSLEKDGVQYSPTLKVCSVCKEPLEKELVLLGKVRRVRIACSCKIRSEEERRHKDEERERQIFLDRIFKSSLMDEKFKNATFEAWDHSKGDSKLYNISTKYGKNFKKVRKENIGLIIYGPPGNGKTYAVCSIGNHLLRNGVPTVCVSINKLLDRIKETYNSYGKEDEERVLRGFCNADFLIIDDLGTELFNEWSSSRIYKIIDARYRNNLPVVITTNLSMRDFRGRYDERVCDRLKEMCVTVYCEGSSIRGKEGLRKHEDLRDIVK